MLQLVLKNTPLGSVIRGDFMRKALFYALLCLIHLIFAFASMAKPFQIRQGKPVVSKRNFLEHSKITFQNGIGFFKSETAAPSNPAHVCEQEKR